MHRSFRVYSKREFGRRSIWDNWPSNHMYRRNRQFAALGFCVFRETDREAWIRQWSKMVYRNHFLHKRCRGWLAVLPFCVSTCSLWYLRSEPQRVLWKKSICISWNMQIHCTFAAQSIHYWWLEHCRNYVQCCLSKNQVC